MAQCDAQFQLRLVDELIETSPEAKCLDMVVGEELDRSQQHILCCPDHQTYPDLHKKKHGQQVTRSCLIVRFQCLKVVHKKKGERLFSRACSDRTRGMFFSSKQVDLGWL